MGVSETAYSTISVTIRVGHFKKLDSCIQEKYIESMHHVHENEIVYDHEKLKNDDSEISYTIRTLIGLSRYGRDRTDDSCVSVPYEEVLKEFNEGIEEAKEINNTVFKGMGYVSVSQLLIRG